MIKRFFIQGNGFFRRALVLLPAFLAVLLLSGCGKEHTEEPGEVPEDRSEGRRTVLIYMAAQNSLGSSGYEYHRRDSAEVMMGRSYIPDDGRLLMFIDDASCPRLYRVTKDRATPLLVRSWDTDVNSSSPDVFQDVLSWVRDTYPATEYGLVMWSHADGWLPATNTDYAVSRKALSPRPASFGIDNGTTTGSNRGTQMEVTDMAAAIQAAGLHLRYLFFDACLMQNIEVDYALKDVTDYVIASPISVSADGVNYTSQLRDAFFDEDPTKIVSTAYDDMTAAMAAQTDDFGMVMSAVRTDALEALAQAFSQALPQSSLVGRQSPDMSGVTNYQTYTKSYYYRPHNYDAAEAINALFPPDVAMPLIVALDEVVARKAATSTFWIGPGNYTFQNVNRNTYCALSLFVPQAAYTANAASCAVGDHNANFRNTAWYQAAGWAQTEW
jgi:hypothetical protein